MTQVKDMLQRPKSRSYSVDSAIAAQGYEETLSSEDSPLIPRSRPGSSLTPLINWTHVYAISVIVLLCIGSGLWWRSGHLANANELKLWEDQRTQWEKAGQRDEQNWHDQQVFYNRDKQNWESERQKMSDERSQFETDSAEWKKERDSWTIQRKQWALEKQKYDEEHLAYQHDLRQWENDWQQYLQNEYDWKEQQNKFKAEFEDWKIQRASWKSEWEKWEREKQNHDGSYPAPAPGSFWDKPEIAQSCHSYGKREYSSRLWNIPIGWDWKDACKILPIDLHGITLMTPDLCENRGFLGMWGHWIVSSGEIECQPMLKDFKDLGCIAPGTRTKRVEAEITGIRQQDDWQVMCGTTPAIIDGLNRSEPSHCEERAEGKKYAIWDIYDPSC